MEHHRSMQNHDKFMLTQVKVRVTCKFILKSFMFVTNIIRYFALFIHVSYFYFCSDYNGTEDYYYGIITIFFVLFICQAPKIHDRIKVTLIKHLIMLFFISH